MFGERSFNEMRSSLVRGNDHGRKGLCRGILVKEENQEVRGDAGVGWQRRGRAKRVLPSQEHGAKGCAKRVYSFFFISFSDT